MSSKGQIVIPKELRKDFKSGDEFLVIKSKGRLVLKKVDELKENLKEDLDFAKFVDDAWNEYDSKKPKSKNKKEFLKELEKW